MKYSIIINPQSKNSKATTHAFNFVKALIQNKIQKIDVFFYGLAVESAFVSNDDWEKVAQLGVSIVACSTLAESYLSKQLSTVTFVTLGGLAQWMESVLDADKNIEFI